LSDGVEGDKIKLIKDEIIKPKIVTKQYYNQYGTKIINL